MEKRGCKSKELIALGVIFLISVIVRFAVCGDYILTRIYPDELRYFHIAQSIAGGRGIQIYNAHTNFSKVFYSLLISPAFMFGDRYTQIKVVELINSIIVSSTIWVSYLFAKRIISNWKLRILACSLCAILPDFLYSMTYFSETAFLPMATLLFYSVFTLYDDERVNGIVRGLLMGAGMYLVFLTKEVALVFGFVIVYEGIVYAINKRRDKVIACIICCITFVACFVLAKYTVFRGMGSSYNQTGIEILSEPGRLGFLVYGFFYYLMNVLFSGGVLVIVPALRYRELPEKAKKLLWMTVLLVLLSAFTIAYTITIREDFDGGLPRAHMRYICYIWPVLIMLFVSLFEAVEEKLNLLSSGAICLLILVGVVFYREALDASGRDQQMLNVLISHQDKLWLAYRIMLIAVVLITVLAKKQFRKVALSILLSVFIIVQSSNNIDGILSNRDVNKVSAKRQKDVRELVELITGNPDKTFVIAANSSKLNKDQSIIDTFLIYKNVYVINREYLLARQTEEGFDVETSPVGSFLPECEFMLNDVDYILIKRDAGIGFDKATLHDLTEDSKLVATYEISGNKVIPHVNITE